MKLQTIYRRVYSVKSKITPKTTVTGAVRLLQNAFRHSPWIRFYNFQLPITPNNPGDCYPEHFVVVSGELHRNHDDSPEVRIYLTRCADSQVLPTDARALHQLLFDIFTTIAHEQIHLLQSEKAKGCPRNYHVKHADPDVKKLYEYYGSTGEIDAYGNTAALEAKYGFHAEVLERYKEIFKPDDPRYKRFLKKTWKYGLTLPNIDDINK